MKPSAFKFPLIKPNHSLLDAIKSSLKESKVPEKKLKFSDIKNQSSSEESDKASLDELEPINESSDKEEKIFNKVSA